MDEFLIKNANFKRLYEEFHKYGSLSIGLDFDNTVYDYHQKGHKYPKVIRIVRRAANLGMQIHMFTANPDVEKIKQHMANIAIPIQGINTNGVDLGYENRKPFYSLLLCDRAGLRSAYKDLKKLVEQLESEKPPVIGYKNVPSSQGGPSKGDIVIDEPPMRPKFT